MRASTAAAAVIGIALLVTGCSVQDAPSPVRSPSQDTAGGSSGEDVSYDEYRAGFDLFESCMEQAGYSLVNVEESNSVIRFSMPAAAVESQVADECYKNNFQALDVAWQLANEDTSESADFLRYCLEEGGLDSAGTMEELSKRVTDAGIDLADCLEGME